MRNSVNYKITVIVNFIKYLLSNFTEWEKFRSRFLHSPLFDVSKVQHNFLHRCRFIFFVIWKFKGEKEKKEKKVKWNALTTSKLSLQTFIIRPGIVELFPKAILIISSAFCNNGKMKIYNFKCHDWTLEISLKNAFFFSFIFCIAQKTFHHMKLDRSRLCKYSQTSGFVNNDLNTANRIKRVPRCFSSPLSTHCLHFPLKFTSHLLSVIKTKQNVAVEGEKKVHRIDGGNQ